MPPYLLDLPLELGVKIAFHVQDEGADGAAVRREDLQSCMLVCKAFSTLFRPYIYRVLRLLDLAAVEYYFEHLSARPGYARFVKTLHVFKGWDVVQSDAFPELLNLLPSVSEVVFGGGAVGSRATKLDFLQLPPRTVGSIVRICTLHSVTRLYVARCINCPGAILDVPGCTLVDVTFDPGSVVPSTVGESGDGEERRPGLGILRDLDVTWSPESAETFGEVVQGYGRRFENVTSLCVGLQVDYGTAWETMEKLIDRSRSLEELEIRIGTDVFTRAFNTEYSVLENAQLNLGNVSQLRRLAFTVFYPTASHIRMFLRILRDIVSSLVGRTLEKVDICMEIVMVNFIEELMDPEVGWAGLEGLLADKEVFPKLVCVRVDLKVPLGIIRGNGWKELSEGVDGMMPAIPRVVFEGRWRSPFFHS
ncbi:hypothetical protein CC2G_007639 [Coprinopsis cinerea AmutBmut pab1-1]|nr:hypothetical protein CC2G_007639 [Coprinopsis cinerea AmutBmut pab1-1]